MSLRRYCLLLSYSARMLQLMHPGHFALTRVSRLNCFLNQSQHPSTLGRSQVDSRKSEHDPMKFKLKVLYSVACLKLLFLTYVSFRLF